MLKDIKVGDYVFVVFQRSRYSPPREPELAQVVKVGNKYGYIQRHGFENPFFLDSGKSHHKDSNARQNGLGFDVYESEAVYREKTHVEEEFYRLEKRLMSDWPKKLGHLPHDAVMQIHAILDSIKDQQ